MTLFDGQPLEDDEVARLVVCECGHIRGAHRGVYSCTICTECEGFTPEQREAWGVRFDA